MEESPSDNACRRSIQEKVFSEQVSTLHTNLLTSVPASYVCALIIFFSLYRHGHGEVIVPWFALVSLVSLSRLTSVYFYRRQTENDRFYLAIFVVNTFLSAVLWGLIGSVYMPQDDVIHQMMIVVIVAGVTAGGMQTLNASVTASLVYLTAIIVPLGTWLFMQGNFSYSLLGMTTIAYFVFMAITSIRGYKLLGTTLFLQYENQALIEKISISNAQLVDYSKSLYEQSTHDSLTGLFNRRYLDETLPRELQRVVREEQSLCVAMLDLDFFKSFNDTHGHAAGDSALRFIGTLLQDTFRESDISCRFGGEEFLVVMVNTDIASAHVRLERFCEMIRQERILFHGQYLPSMTMSVGIAEAPGQGIEAEEIIRAADKALYYAKKTGRNRIESALSA